MNYWLVKTEPGEYSYDDLAKDKVEPWDGVRNYAARNHMMAMKKGDQVLVYHSVSEKQVVGIATVKNEHHQDPTTDDERWRCVDLAPHKKLKNPVTLADIKSDKKLQEMMLVRIGRLSVMPVTKAEFDRIIERGS